MWNNNNVIRYSVLIDDRRIYYFYWNRLEKPRTRHTFRDRRVVYNQFYRLMFNSFRLPAGLRLDGCCWLGGAAGWLCWLVLPCAIIFTPFVGYPGAAPILWPGDVTPTPTAARTGGDVMSGGDWTWQGRSYCWGNRGNCLGKKLSILKFTRPKYCQTVLLTSHEGRLIAREQANICIFFDTLRRMASPSKTT